MKAGEHLTVPCEYCGTDYRQSRCDQRFCSKRCVEASWRARQPRDVRCPVCESQVPVRQRTYCSAACRIEAERIRRKAPEGSPGKGWSLGTQTAPRQTCEVCESAFYAPPIQIIRGGGKFCSVSCRARFQSEHPDRYSRGTSTRRGKTGKRPDLHNRYFRSSWEANYARYLNLLVSHGKIVKWEYEVDTFEFPVKRGSRFYLPDFKVWTSEVEFEYHEVKGYMDPKSATKLKRMAKHYPKTKVVLIDAPVYRSLGRTVSALLPHWEYSENGKRGY